MRLDRIASCYLSIPKRNNKRQTGKSKRKTNGNTVTSSVHIPPRNYLSTHIPGIQQTLRRTLVNVNQSTYTISAGFAELGQYVVNSPYHTFGSTNAIGYDKYMAFYSKCFVHGARIKWSGAPASLSVGVNATEPILWGVTINTNSTVLTSTVSAISEGLCSYKLNNQAPDSVMLTEGVDIGKFMNVPNILNNPQLFSTSSAFPDQIIVAHVWAQNYVGSANLLCFLTEIELDVTFTDPIPFT
jgi:hypothetical protein